VGGEMAQIMYTHVSKCKNDKIKWKWKTGDPEHNGINVPYVWFFSGAVGGVASPFPWDCFPSHEFTLKALTEATETIGKKVWQMCHLA
jgi:hypothetical protein